MQNYKNDSSSSQLTEFQKAAVTRIVERLNSTRGSKRFLLSDEVGL